MKHTLFILFVLVGRVAYSDPTSALFTEDFNGEAALIGRNYQAQTFLSVKHGHELPGWAKQGDDMPAHWVEQSPGNWALMLVANRAEQNIFTQKKGMTVNDKGHVYTVSLDAGPAVYAGLGQETAAGDQIVVELLRPDSTVLKKHMVTPGEWLGKLVLENHTFTYKGDGTGPLRLRLSPVYISGVRFFGAIDHVQIFDSADTAVAAIAARKAVERPAREQMARTAPMRRQEAYASVTPKFAFAETLHEQEEQLKNNPLMLRFAASRLKHAADPYRPAYHFVSPESRLNDGNGLCFWQGRWHLFYQGYPPDEFPDVKDTYKRRQHWGHVVSDDLVHWRDLPYAIYPGIERMCFSGGTLVEENRVSAYYLGINAGQMLATSSDPLLLNWKQQRIETSHSGDGDIWKQGDKYIGLVGGMRLSSSDDLVNWKKLGRMVDHNSPFARECDDASCPNFHPIEDKHILLCFSHKKGGQYLLGDYDPANLKFIPYAHGRFNRGWVMPGSVHAPSSASDDKGRLYNIFNINTGKGSADDWDHVMSVPQRLSLDSHKQLKIEPVAALNSLRGAHQQIGRTVLTANKDIVFDAIKGNSMELEVDISPQDSGLVQLSVLRSPDAEERTTITFYNHDHKLGNWYATPSVIVLDGSQSSIRGDVDMRPLERATLGKGRNEPLKLRIFIDRSIVEVFANGKQYLAMRVYPDRSDSLGVSIRAQGQDAVLNKLDAWQMKAIWPLSSVKK